MGAFLKWLSSPDGKPSWMVSSTSQLLAISTVAYVAGAFYFMRHGNLEAGFAALAGIFNSFMALYAHRKGADSATASADASSDAPHPQAGG